MRDQKQGPPEWRWRTLHSFPLPKWLEQDKGEDGATSAFSAGGGKGGLSSVLSNDPLGMKQRQQRTGLAEAATVNILEILHG